MASETIKCPDCGCEEIEYEPARGATACMECGKVIEQSLIVNEVGFAEDARGRANLVGQHVRADGRFSSFGGLHGMSREGTELSMAHAKRRMFQLVSSVKLQTRHAESGLRVFRLALDHNFHKGRRMTNVCCACLYVVCRMEKTPHMLLDFADALETNVYTLGHMFLKLVKILSIQLPVIDPSLYIHRFASRLEFGDDLQDVSMSALRIIARMQRNWMSEGRRPSGLCGAALMIAARFHNHYRTQSEVARVVRIGNIVLKERLSELCRTAEASLTVQEIDDGGGDDGKSSSIRPSENDTPRDPPAYERLQRKKRRVASQGSTDLENAKSKNIRSGSDSEVASVQNPRASDMSEEAALAEEISKELASDEFKDLGIDTSEICEEETETGRNQIGTGVKVCTAEEYKEVQIKMKEGALDKDVEDEDELSELEDEDVGQYLNTDAEFKRKEVIWTEANKEYIEKQEQMERLRRERPEDYKKLRPRSSKKRRKSTSTTRAAISSSEDEEDEEPPEPRRSSKLNYSILNTLEESEDEE